METPRQLVEELFADHEIGDELGRGSFGSVWAARHRELGRAVAIKLLLGTSEDDRARFRREARLLAAVRHPHVVSVYDYREAGPARAIAMEHLGGGTFDRRGPELSAAGRLAVALAAASALEHVHRAGVLHRDVTPGNVMFDAAGHVRVTDFGVAAGGAEDSFATAAGPVGMMVGTPAYVSPEQCAAAVGEHGPAVSTASDQYSLGVVVFEQLTGRLPHDRAGGVLALCRRRLTEPPAELGPLRPDLPAALAAAVMRSLQRHPGDRFASVEEFGVALASAVRDEAGPTWLEQAGVDLADPGPIRAAATAGAGDRSVAAAVAPAAPAATPAATPPGAVAGAAAGAASPGRRRVLFGIGGVGVAALAGGGVWWASRDEDASGAADDGSATTATTVAPGATEVRAVWSAATGASVFSSPAVAGDRVVIGSDDGKIYGLDASTGAIAWSVVTGEPSRSTTPVRSSPAVDGEHVVVAGYDGALRSLALADGAERWRTPVEMTVTATARIVDGLVLVGVDHLRGYDAATGELRWSADGTGVISSSSAAVDGRTAVVGSEDRAVYVVDLDAGAVSWRLPTGGRVLSSPAISGRLAVVGSTDGRLYALDLEGRSIDGAGWSVDLGAPVNSSPAVVDDVVIVGTDAGVVVARALADGSPVWEYRTGNRVSSSPLLVDDRVVVGSNDRAVHVIDRRTGERLGRFETGGAVISTPARVDRSDVVVGSFDSKVYRLRVA